MEVEGGDLSSNHTTLHSVTLDRFLNLTWPPAHLLLLLRRHLEVGEPFAPSSAPPPIASPRLCWTAFSLLCGAVMARSYFVELGKEEEDDYQLLRKAVTEYRDTTSEYYNAAIEAYSKGDRAGQTSYQKRGYSFTGKLVKLMKNPPGRNADARDEDIFPLNLSELDALEALHIMKLHLKSLAGSLAFKYMKVTIEGPNGDVLRGVRRRRIMKLMDMKSINWLDGGEPGTILIPLSINQPEPF